MTPTDDTRPSRDDYLTAIALLEATHHEDIDAFEALMPAAQDMVAALCDIALSEIEATSRGHPMCYLEKARRLLLAGEE